jgi:hypothetical protein
VLIPPGFFDKIMYVREDLHLKRIVAGDANCDGGTNVADAVYLINFIFKGGLPPVTYCCP